MNRDFSLTSRIFAPLALAAASLFGQSLAPAPPPPARIAVSPAPAVAPTPAPSAVARPAVAARPGRPPRAAMPALAGSRWTFEGGYLGVELVDLTPELREHFDAPREAGVMIGRVEPEGPAARAGLEVGDIVVELAGNAIHDSWALSRAVADGGDDEPAPISFVRGGKRQSSTVKLEKRFRRGFDVGGLLAPPPGTPFPEAPMALAPAIDHLRGMLEQPEFGERLREMQSEIDREVASKMKELERRLAELEEKLERNER